MEVEKQLDLWREAGKISIKAKEFARKIVNKDKSILDITSEIESKIRELGANPAFPVNIGINEKAAHFTPSKEDNFCLGENLVKIDLGVEIEGLAADTAFTLDLTPENKFKELIEVTEEAFYKAAKIAKPGMKISEIGRIVQDTITKKGFSPIRNLSGHEIWPYSLHAGLSIPNYDNGSTAELEEDMVIAIEPFATKGEGLVKDGKEGNVFMIEERKPVRDSHAREVLNFIEEEYGTLPFAGRWIEDQFGLRGRMSLRLLSRERILHNYKELIEISGMAVAQKENTIIVKDKPEMITE